MPKRSRVTLSIATALGLLFTCLTTLLPADPIVSEPFLSGADPAAGEYAPGQPLAPSGNPGQNPAVPGFTGAWQGGTSLLTSEGTVLSGSPAYATGGSARFQWTSNLARQVYRQLDSYTSGHPVYYLSGLMELDPNFRTATDASAWTKLLGIHGSGTYGMRWGFQGDGSEIDAVVSYRVSSTSTPTYVLQHGLAPGTHRFVMRIEQNSRSWYDRVAVWLDPDPTLGEADLDAWKLLEESGSWNDGALPVNRLYVEGRNAGANVPVHYDEVRFGTSWDDVVPESAGMPGRLLLDESFSGADGTQPPGWTAYAGTTNLVAGNDGNGEYELAKVVTPAGSPNIIASYSDENDVARGNWRDVTILADTRFSGSPDNDNGLIFRARDITAATGSGDFYHVRVNGSNLQLYRFVNGSATLLDTASLSGFDPYSRTNRYRISVENVPNPATDHVQIVAELFNDEAFTNLAGQIDFLDTASNAITRPGGAGFRAYTRAGVSRAVFDDLIAVNDNPGLLWYDDFSDGQAPNMQSYGTKTQNVTARKYQFQSGSGEGLGFIDLPAVTSQAEWADVEVRALMRMGSNGPGLAGGIIARATGITGPGTGDFYMYRLQRAGTDRAELYRRNSGTFTLLGDVDLGFDVASSTPVFLRLLTMDVGDEVMLWGQASYRPDFGDVFGDLRFMDDTAARLLGPGSAGFRAYGSGTINFDNFTVTTAAIPEPASILLMGLGAVGLLWFARKRRSNRPPAE